MIAIGLLGAAARDRATRSSGASKERACGAVSIAFVISLGARPARDPRLPRGVATAVDSLRSFFDVGRARAALPRRPRSAAATSTWRSASRCSASRRAIALWVDRPRAGASLDRGAASPAIGAAVAAAAVLAPPRDVRPCGTDRAARPRAPARLAPSRLGLALARRSDRPARPLGEPSGRAPRCRSRGRRAPLLERRVRLGRWSCSASGIWATVLHMPILVGALARPRTASRSSSRSACSPRRCCSAPSTCSARSRASPQHASGPSSARRRAGCSARVDLAARRCWSPPPSSRRPCSRASRRPSKALAEESVGARPRRPGPRRGDRPPERLHAAGARHAEQGGGARTLRAPDHEGRQARRGRRRDRSPSRCSTWRWQTRNTSSARPRPASTHGPRRRS